MPRPRLAPSSNGLFRSFTPNRIYATRAGGDLGTPPSLTGAPSVRRAGHLHRPRGPGLLLAVQRRGDMPVVRAAAQARVAIGREARLDRQAGSRSNAPDARTGAATRRAGARPSGSRAIQAEPATNGAGPRVRRARAPAQPVAHTCRASHYLNMQQIDLDRQLGYEPRKNGRKQRHTGAPAASTLVITLAGLSGLRAVDGPDRVVGSGFSGFGGV